jgi:hypothetical protein
MKYYVLVRLSKINNIPIAPLNGESVKNYKDFFETGCTINTFFDKDYEFDFLTPMNRGEIKEEVQMIADYHGWIGKEPMKGYFRPISPKFKEILGQFQLPPHKFYNAKVLFKGVFYPYFVMHLLYNSYRSYIDYTKTIFNNLNSFGKLKQAQKETKKFSSFEEMQAYSDTHWNYNWNYERLVMLPSFRNIDYCCMYNIAGDLVSEQLKNALEKAEMTGITFQEYHMIILE